MLSVLVPLVAGNTVTCTMHRSKHADTSTGTHAHSMHENTFRHICTHIYTVIEMIHSETQAMHAGTHTFTNIHIQTHTNTRTTQMVKSHS